MTAFHGAVRATGVEGAYSTGPHPAGPTASERVGTDAHAMGYATPGAPFPAGSQPAGRRPSHQTPTPGTQVMSSDASIPPLNTVGTMAPSSSNARLFALVGAATVILLVVAIVGWALLRPTTNTNVANTNAATNTNTLVTAPVPEGMVLIAGGTFKTGIDNPPDPYYSESKPAHDVTLKDFYIDQYEVTNEDYQQFVRRGGRPAPKHWRGGEFPPGEGRFPVTNVSWFDAEAYAKSVGKRLPTEAEWERAARGDKNGIYPWGNDWDPRLSNSREDGRNKPLQVGSYPAGVSPFGVFDMAGNVAEWVADDYAPYPGSDAKPDPGKKVYRGGAFNLGKGDLVVTNRFWDVPTTSQPWLGFRLAQDVQK